jgi:DEAD/DEAH box helicase domain-containing protein
MAANASTDLDSPLVALARHNAEAATVAIPRAQADAFTHNALAHLLRLLATPTTPTEDPAVTQLQKNAMWLNFLMVPATPADRQKVESDRAPWLALLPEAMRSPGAGYAPCLSKDEARPWVVAWWPLTYLQSQSGVVMAPGVVVLDDVHPGDNKLQRLHWRRCLQLFNTLQTLRGFRMASLAGLQAKDLDALVDGDTTAPTLAPAQGSQLAWAQEWQGALDQCIAALVPGLRRLAQDQGQAPVVGLELPDAQGRVLADAELAWPDAKVVVLRADQADLAVHWQDAHWHVELLDADGLHVQAQDWHVVVAAALKQAAIAKESP